MPLHAGITDVQPQTGIALWDGAYDHDDVKSNGTIATTSLLGLLPGEVRRIEVPTAVTPSSVIHISGSRLVGGQSIQFRARLTENARPSAP